MSSDETDTEGQHVVKHVRRVAKAWVCDEISDLWSTVEKIGLGDPKRGGNKPHPRIHASSSTNSTSRAASGLPANFYNSLWWKSLHEGQQADLRPGVHMRIPSKVRIYAVVGYDCNSLTSY
jgi:hypothetical protein